MKIKYYSTYFISILIVISVCSLFLAGCSSEPKYTAEEWGKIQEDEEYLSIRDEIIEFDKEYNRITEEFNNEIDSLNDSSNSKEGSTELLEQKIELTEDFKNEFQKLRMPEPLDDFYYLKLEELDWVLKEREHLRLMIVINPPEDSSLASSLFEDWGELKEKIDNLKLEANKEKRKVYREYDLDDLLID